MNDILKILKHKEGSVTLLLTFFMVAILGFTALVIDVGLIFVEKSRLDQALDAAVLAGVQDLPFGSAVAIQTAKNYLALNGVASDEAIIEIDEDGKGIRVSTQKQVNHFFAPVLGIEFTTIRSTAKAMMGPAGSVSNGLRPVAITDYPLIYGDLVTLKEGAGDGTTGNYGAVSFGPTGACVFKNYLIYGYTGSISVGDSIQTEPGNMAGAIASLSSYLSSDHSTFDNYSQSSKRLWTIPVVNTLDVNGRKSVDVVGFAQFFVEEASKNAGQAVIKGRFIKFVTSGEMDTTIEDRGVYVSKLSR